MILVLGFISSIGFIQYGSAMDNHFTFTELVKNSILPTGKPDLRMPVYSRSMEDFLHQNQDIKVILKQFLALKKKIFPYQQWIISPQAEQILNSPSYLSPGIFIEILGVHADAFNNLKVSEVYKDIKGQGIDIHTSLPLIEWIEAFNDEPDWGMDDDLFGGNDPRYKEIPFGTLGKTSSRAPFHCYYGNEKWITYLGKSTLKESMAPLRFILFYQLAKYSFARGENFWGARFLGNAIHYLQDITTPYHSSAVPYATWASYFQYFRSKNKSEFIRQKTQITSNKHALYEKLAGVLVQTFIHSQLPLNSFLDEAVSFCNAKVVKKNRKALETNPIPFFKGISKRAYKSSLKVDPMIDTIFPQELVANPDSDLDQDQNFSIFNYYSQEFLISYLKGDEMDSDKTELLDLIRTDLNSTIEVTSSMICSIFAK